MLSLGLLLGFVNSAGPPHARLTGLGCFRLKVLYIGVSIL